MKIQVILILMSIVMAFLSGYLLIAVKTPESSDVSISSQVSKIKREFQAQHKALQKINPLSLYPAKDVAQLVSPEGLLPSTHKYPLRSLRLLLSYGQTCKGRYLEALRAEELEASLEKELIWKKFECGQILQLPRKFFDSPPYISPFGNSYALLFLRSQRETDLSEWLQAHLTVFHVSELDEVLRELRHRPVIYKVLAQMDDVALRGIVSKDSLLLSRDYVLMQNSSSRTSLSMFPDGSSVYSVFERASWDRFLSQFPVILSAADSGCLQKEGQLCWGTNDRSYRQFQNPFLALFAVSILLTMMSIVLVFKRVKSQKLEEERKRFALQTLTHELRTPIASLMMSAEAMIDRYDSAPESLQPHILRVADDTQRLKRLAEISRQYLAAHQSKKTVQFNIQPIESINSYLTEVLATYGSKIKFCPLIRDEKGSFDPYWVSVCITNLIENALAHGKPPVEVGVEIHESQLEVVVKDEGAFKGPLFSKGISSQGLGMGLSIVKKIVEDMKGELFFERTPTRFGIRIESEL